MDRRKSYLTQYLMQYSDPRTGQSFLLPVMEGQQGAQSGRVQESPTMGGERTKQKVGGMLKVGAGIPVGYGGVAGANLPLALIGSALAAAGMDDFTNAHSPNIRDVYADRARMKRQGK